MTEQKVAIVTGAAGGIGAAIVRALCADGVAVLGTGRSADKLAALAAALPGGDPLTIAVAASETPSPKMVAGAGGSGTLRPAVASACLVAILAGLVEVWFFQAQTSRFRHVPFTAVAGRTESGRALRSRRDRLLRAARRHGLRVRMEH